MRSQGAKQHFPQAPTRSRYPHREQRELGFTKIVAPNIVEIGGSRFQFGERQCVSNNSEAFAFASPITHSLYDAR